MGLYDKQSYTAAPKPTPTMDAIKAGAAKVTSANEAVNGAVNEAVQPTNQPYTGEVPTGTTFKGYDDQGRPQFTETPAPDTISGVVDQTGKTYAEKAASINKGSYLEAAESFENITGKRAPFSSQEEFLAWRDNQNQEDLDYLDEQQNYSRDIEKIQFDQAKQQAAGAISGVEANMAQGREGAMSGTAPQFTSQFKEEIGRNMEQIQIQKASAERSRDKALVDLKRAQESGDLNMASAIQGRIDSIEQDLRNTDSQALQIATQANAQALQQAQFEHSASIDNQAAYRANLGVFTTMVDAGNTMTNEQISQFAGQLGVPFEVADSYYQSAQMVRADKSMTLEEQNIKLQDLAYDFNLKLDGIVGEKAQQVYGIMDMVKKGKLTTAEAQNIFMGLEIDNSMNPITQMNLKMTQLDASAKEIGLKYLDAEKRQALTMGKQQITSNDLDNMIKKAKAQHADENEILALEQMRIDVRKAEIEKNEYEQSFVDELDTDTAKTIFDRNIKSDYGHGLGKAECGEAFNDFTDGPNVGNSYASKTNHIDENITMPKVGNGLVLPLKIGGTLEFGHIETVISSNPTLGTFQTVSYNRDGKGGRTFETYNVNDLENKYSDQKWGFINSELKSEYSEQIPKATDTGGDGATDTGGDGLFNQFKQQAADEGMTDPDAIEKFATDRLNDSYGSMTEAQSSAYDAYRKIRPENELYDELVEGFDDAKLEEFAKAVNVVTRQIKDDGLTSEIINNNIDDPNIRRLIMSEMRFIEGKLRKESGATITAYEYQTNGTMYFMRSGDESPDIKIKADRRKSIEKGLVGQTGAVGNRLISEEYDMGGEAEKDQGPAWWQDVATELISGAHNESGQYMVIEDAEEAGYNSDFF